MVLRFCALQKAQAIGWQITRGGLRLCFTATATWVPPWGMGKGSEVPCWHSHVARTWPWKAKGLDRLFKHRLLDLIYNTIPTCGDARFCSEFVLKLAYQQLKNWFALNTHSNAHNTLMDKAIARNWLWCFSSLRPELIGSEGFNQSRTETRLGRLLLGEYGLRVDEYTPNDRLFVTELRSSSH